MELIVGRVLEANDHPGARAPSYLLRLDAGSRGEIEAQMEPGGQSKEELLGSFVVVSLDDEAIVLCARSPAHGPVLLRPDRDVEPGTADRRVATGVISLKEGSMSQPVEPEDHPLQPEDDDSELRYDHRTSEVDDDGELDRTKPTTGRYCRPGITSRRCAGSARPQAR